MCAARAAVCHGGGWDLPAAAGRAGSAGQAPNASCSHMPWQLAVLLSSQCQRPSMVEQGPMDSATEQGAKVGRGA